MRDRARSVILHALFRLGEEHSNGQTGDSRCLEEIHPPVGRPQVKHVGPLAVVRSSHGQRVVDGHGVLQVLVR